MREIIEVAKPFNAMDLKKFANMNPNKKLQPVIKKKESLHKIAKMFKNLI